MGNFGSTLFLSLLLHGLLFYFAQNLPAQPKNPPKRPVKMRVIDKPKPPPPKPKAEPPKPKPKPKTVEPPKKKIKRAPKRKKTAPVEEPKPAEAPPPPKPKPPPMGFSVDMSSTVVAGNGVAVAAVEGGGNMFADPNDRTLEPGTRTAEPAAPATGKGTGKGRGDTVVTMPVLLTEGDARIPPYPEGAKDIGIEGQVGLRLYIGVSGTVEKVRVVKKLHPLCDAAAVAHARRMWKFEPATEDGVAVGMWIPFAVTFELER